MVKAIIELKNQYKEELKRVDKGKFKRFYSINNLRKEIENLKPEK